MVKIRVPILLASLAILSGCAARALLVTHPQSLVFPGIVPGRTVSLASTGSALIGVFSDTAATTLDQVQIPLGEHLPASPPAVTVIDKVDTSPPLATTFGAHVLLVQEGQESVLYLDRESENKSVLKLVSRPVSSASWLLDIMEPTGFPVALLPGDRGTLKIFWVSGGLMARFDRSAPLTLLRPFDAVSPGTRGGTDAFTAFDDTAGTLFLLRSTADGIAVSPIDGGSRVQSSAETPDGRAAILTWDESSRRLLLLEQERTSGKFTRTIVTLCEGTTAVQLLPGRTGAPYMFLFVESVRRGGATLQQLSLIAPASTLGASGGGRYRKTVLYADDARIAGFSAVRAPDALYVLVAGESLSLLRIALN